jgi:hypothetical protein
VVVQDQDLVQAQPLGFFLWPKCEDEEEDSVEQEVEDEEGASVGWTSPAVTVTYWVA